MRPSTGFRASTRRLHSTTLSLATALILSGFALATPAAGQEDAPGEAAAAENGALRVFFDCNTGGGVCDFDFYRREIPFVNYTRDRTDAQVHVLLTSEGTGAGGQRFTLDFLGREEFTGIDDRLEVSTAPNSAQEQRLTAVAGRLRLGLIRYVARTDQADDITIQYEAGVSPRAVARPETDPWNFWVFRLRGSTNFDIDESTEGFRLGGGLSANRITDGLKLELSLNGSYNENRFDIDDTTSVTSIRRNYGVDALTVWSLSDHWSIGATAGAEHSTFSNYDLSAVIAPAIEYNIFPYNESTRRQLSFLYAIGMRYFDYIEETVFLETKETRPQHSLTASLSVRQPWGGMFGFLEFEQFLNELGSNRLELFAGTDIRLLRGLSLNFNGSVSRVRNQINLPAGDATTEEILLRQRELETGFRIRFSVGFSYTFGSIFTNVVNPRFESF